MRIKLPSASLLALALLSPSSSSVGDAFAFTQSSTSTSVAFSSSTTRITHSTKSSSLFAQGNGGGGNFFRPIKNKKDDEDDEEEDEDDEEEEESLYEQFASSEFLTNESKLASSPSNQSSNQKATDWGGEYDTLRNRFDDVKNNKTGPSNTLFRIMTSQTPNESIMSFINDASPQVITAMSSTVTNLLGGLTNPSTGMEMIVKANGDKLGSLCFQLQMTGYMFRNAEYVLAIRDLMNIHGQASLQEYKDAFDKLDADGSGFIEANEVQVLLSDVYGETNIPSFEVDAFLNFFDSNNDGRISWDEFERGLGVVADSKAKETRKKSRTNANANANTAMAALLAGKTDDDDDDEDDDDDDYLEDIMTDSLEPNISGKVKIEMKNGRVIEVEAKEYINELKKEAEALKAALRREKESSPNDEQSSPLSPNGMPPMAMGMQQQQQQQQPGGKDDELGISGYIASLGGDIQSLTKGISPEVVDAMKKLIDFVLDGGTSGRGKGRKDDKDLEMEIPSSALQQLALWQLVLGYKLREAEATGEYRKMLE